MRQRNVSLEVVLLDKRLSTQVTYEVALASVNELDVLVEVCGLREGTSTRVAHVCAFARVKQFVSTQILTQGERFATGGALVIGGRATCPSGLDAGGKTAKARGAGRLRLAARGAGVGPVPAVDEAVSVEILSLSEMASAVDA